MKTINAPTPYGYQELRRLHQRYMGLAMLVSIVLQLTIIGGYHLTEWLKPPDDVVIPWHNRSIICFLPPPPPLHPVNEAGIIPIIAANLLKGIPIPMPNAIVDTSKEFASQTQLSNIANTTFAQIGEGLNNGTIVISPDEVDPSPDTFRPIENEPMAILTPRPEYPELAMKADIEGSVVVKVLLDKEGKVKKTMIAKTSDEMFNQPAIDAAQKWVFTPALMNGKPVQVWITIPFKFKLKN